MYYRNAAGIIIAYDVTNGDSFVSTKRWIEEVKENCDENGTPIILVGNKCDIANKVVSIKDQEEYAKLMRVSFFETSAKENINVEVAFLELSKLMLASQQLQSSKVDHINLNGKEKNANRKPIRC